MSPYFLFSEIICRERVSSASSSESFNCNTDDSESRNKNEQNDSNVLNKKAFAIDHGETIDNEEMVITETLDYFPLEYHWFYSKHISDKCFWEPMSMKDSTHLETLYSQKKEIIHKIRIDRAIPDNFNDFITRIKGGRYEVNLIEMSKRPIYWVDKKESSVRRCLWFYKENNDQRFTPYEDQYSEFLESEFEKTIKTNSFHKRIDYIRNYPMEDEQSLGTGCTFKKMTSVISEEAFVFHSTSIMLHFSQADMLDEFGNLNSDAKRPRIVKRGVKEVVEKVEADEIDEIDHVCFVVHGIGEGCDMKFRPLIDCVDDFRDIGAYISDVHLKQHTSSANQSGRVEFLPIYWHEELHGEENDPTAVDNKLKPISLPSIPKLRQFSNTTILDVLFYTSPIYCQTIISKVGNELNRLSKIFFDRNPNFKGKISLIGHSLGSLIIFDLLTHQILFNERDMPLKDESKNETLDHLLERLNLNEFKELFDKEKISLDSLGLLDDADLIKIGLPLGPRRVLLNEIKQIFLRKEINEVKTKIKINLEQLNRIENEKIADCTENNGKTDYFNYGIAGTGQLAVKYPQLNFKVENFFALGSPIAMFLTIRGIHNIDSNFKFPTCEKFFNIFHPFDPIAYRIEPLICKNPILKPVQMAHHKGRKRMHLELKEGISKVAEEVRVNMYGQIKNAWSSITEFARLPMLSNTSASAQAELIESSSAFEQMSNQQEKELKTEKDTREKEMFSKLNFGLLNQGKRIDYVLQESPIESFNEYLFALASHACYWESEDTLLLILKEVYGIEYLNDSNIELQLNEQQQQQSSWITQTAASAISSNVQKTFSYFNIGFPSITSALTTSSSVPSNSNQSK